MNFTHNIFIQKLTMIFQKIDKIDIDEKIRKFNKNLFYKKTFYFYFFSYYIVN